MVQLPIYSVASLGGAFDHRSSSSKEVETVNCEKIHSPKELKKFLVTNPTLGRRTHQERFFAALSEIISVFVYIKKKQPIHHSMSDPVNEFLQRSGPAVSQLSFGGVVGYCSGMAFRRVGKAVGVVIGLGFIGLQTASSFGYLQVDWDKIRDDAIKPLDTVSSLLF